jgi:hypothetical protein
MPAFGRQSQGANSHFSLSLCRLGFPVIAARCKTTASSSQGGEFTTASAMGDCKNILFFD